MRAIWCPQMSQGIYTTCNHMAPRSQHAHITVLFSTILQHFLFTDTCIAIFHKGKVSTMWKFFMAFSFWGRTPQTARLRPNWTTPVRVTAPYPLCLLTWLSYSFHFPRLQWEYNGLVSRLMSQAVYQTMNGQSSAKDDADDADLQC